MSPKQRFGFIGLEAGVTPRHIWILLYAAYVTIGLATFDAFDALRPQHCPGDPGYRAGRGGGPP